MHNSFDDLENARALSRRSTGGDSGKFGLGAITEAEFSSEGLGKITADPVTREHWKVCQRIFFFLLLLIRCWEGPVSFIRQDQKLGGGGIDGLI